MFPWFFFWCPQWHLPLSGEVRQRFTPEMFFGEIPTTSGNGEIEAEVFERVASYGRQIGVLTEVVLSLCDRSLVPEAEAAHALEQLKSLRARVEAVKALHGAGSRVAGASR